MYRDRSPASWGLWSWPPRSSWSRSWRWAWSSSPSVRPVHVLGPGLELVAHRLLGGADDRGRHVVGLEVLPGVAVEADPIAALGFEALVGLPEVPQVVGIDHRRWRVDEVVVAECAAVDRLGRALETEVPDLGQRLVDAERPHGAQLLQRRLHREAGIEQHMVDIDAEDLLH